MVIDELQHAAQYHALGARFEKGLRWLADNDVAAMTPERYDIDGDDVFVMVQEYDSKSKADGFWEAHRQYADIQLVVSGAEHMGYTPTTSLKAGEYDDSRDFLPLDGEGMFIEMRAGTFMILWPQDAHMPGMEIDSSSPVKKAVVKVRL
ncbi:MAG TPA: YhcH/YjgK/YiaL family protein [Candidatus Latescibacteria bacterium]|nr:YhcH/YjgK/YiaL family protein [Gemmatimonadaceae bacterium]MDP6016573.1 YhcH/YjgK/YiaL family protein [Candidatus Latescibacterota bacterium]HJP34090.1 YhcH/YjgK/YiaL family protein [Candidatus Latescibacterota bacterium]